jgi:CheY-like chemotaxis protein
MQLDSTLARQFDGTGLGLSLVYSLTELHKGSISVESELGEGSRFTVWLPWEPRAVRAGTQVNKRKVLSEFTAVSPTKPSPDKAVTILLAEDNETNIDFIQEYLSFEGYDVVLARNGHEAIARAEEIFPDLILMDIQMPQMDGLEAIHHLRNRPQFTHTPIIALTALAMPGDRERCLAVGASEYLSKPISLKTLMHSISEQLTKRTAVS